MTDPIIKIVKTETSEGETIYELTVNGTKCACLYHNEKGVDLDIYFAGKFQWSQSRDMIKGLVKLSEVGDQLDSGTRKVDGLHQPTDEEIEMAKKKANAKQKKADKKAGKPSAPRETAAALFQELIMDGKLTDDQIFAKVKAKFKLDDKKRSYVAWYRNKLTKDGKKPPAAKE